jgi:hypothetical protein
VVLRLLRERVGTTARVLVLGAGGGIEPLSFVPALRGRYHAHSRIVNAAILSASSVNKKRRSIGLPGKVPVSRHVTTVSLPCEATSVASRVKSYAAWVFAAHWRISSVPR